MSYKPLCFVLMPFGTKSDPSGSSIDFDAVYQELIRPAIVDADLDPVRADEEMTGGIVHKPMFERLILCEYAVADLTFANANVFYELGVRHAVRPWSTVLTFAAGTRLPFDVALDRGVPYSVTPSGDPDDVTSGQQALTRRLVASRDAATDSPIYQLIEGFPQIDRLKTDVFREEVRYSAEWKERLADARRKGIEAVRAAQQQLGDLSEVESGVAIDLFLSYRDVKGWREMVDLAASMPAPLAKTPMVQEQRALALNRLERRDEAERILLDLLDQRGPSSETYGILGRVYKDMWQEAATTGNALRAGGLLDRAINAYLKGFEADWRDAYPGINAVTLMELRDPPDARRVDLIPVVAYAAERRIASGQPYYWDHATRLELAVLAKDEQRANEAARDALAVVRASWEAESTANNLRMIRESRVARGESVPWADAIEDALRHAK